MTAPAVPPLAQDIAQLLRLRILSPETTPKVLAKLQALSRQPALPLLAAR